MTVCEIASVRAAILQVLDRYESTAATGPSDAGPAVIAAMAYDAGDREIAERALGRWLSRFGKGPDDPGVFGGLAGFLAGARTAHRIHPRLDSISRSSAVALATALRHRAWPPLRLVWEDYDLVTGVAGVVLVLARDGQVPTDCTREVAELLNALCSRDDLRALIVRGYRHDRLRSWNRGRVNTGVAHGVAGVLVALAAASERCGSNDLRRSTERVGRLLATWADQAGGEVWRWPIAGPARPGGSPVQAARPQAWCYGTPGIAWALWEAGRVLDLADVRTLAIEAMTSFCRDVDEGRHLPADPDGEDLAFCHGSAGIAMIADSFARHADLAPAVLLRERLTRYMFDRIPAIVDLAASSTDMLNGASGPLAALMTLGGGDRAWLGQYGLR